MDNRLAQLTDWVKQQLANDTLQVESASADASFRRYFRIRATEQTWIAMDAPPEQENSEPFVRISGYLKEMGLTAPVVTAQSWQQGFFLLTDLGNQVYLNMLDEHMADSLYQDAMSALLRMQQQGRNYQAEIPEYGKARLLDEMGLFRDWFLAKHLAIQLTQQQGAILEQVFTFLAEQALQQPHVFVHRDYHSRNLMYLNDATKNPGILDFQDAVWGPVTYDLVSLLRDCYVAWPQQQVMQWVKWYYQQLQTTDLITGVSHDQFIDWFNLMGIQRHLKAIGIFSRLNYRDGKAGYLNDIPRAFDYILQVLSAYPALSDFSKLINQLDIVSRLERKQVIASV